MRIVSICQKWSKNGQFHEIWLKLPYRVDHAYKQPNKKSIFGRFDEIFEQQDPEIRIPGQKLG